MSMEIDGTKYVLTLKKVPQKKEKSEAEKAEAKAKAKAKRDAKKLLPVEDKPKPKDSHKAKERALDRVQKVLGMGLDDINEVLLGDSDETQDEE